MIGTIKKLIIEEKMRNESCPHCKELNSLTTKVYSKMFVLRILPFVISKVTTVDCSGCKKMFSNIFDLPVSAFSKAEEVQQNAKHPWYGYIGFVLIGGIFIISIFR